MPISVLISTFSCTRALPATFPLRGIDLPGYRRLIFIPAILLRLFVLFSVNQKYVRKKIDETHTNAQNFIIFAEEVPVILDNRRSSRFRKLASAVELPWEFSIR